MWSSQKMKKKILINASSIHDLKKNQQQFRKLPIEDNFYNLIKGVSQKKSTANIIATGKTQKA